MNFRIMNIGLLDYNYWMHERVHHFNVAAGDGGDHFNQFIVCWVVCEFLPGIN